MPAVPDCRRPLRTLLRWGMALVTVVLLGSTGCRAIDQHQGSDLLQATGDPKPVAAEAEHQIALGILARAEFIPPCRCTVKEALCSACRAERHLQKALVQDPTHGPAHNTLGTLYLKQRRLYLAAWEFDQAARLMPTRPEPLNNLGLVQEEAGRMDQAASYFSEAVELAPNTAEYVGNLARALYRSGAPIDEYRGVLEQLVFVETRPDWLRWAKGQLGLNPLPGPTVTLASIEEGAETDEASLLPPASEPEVLTPPPADPGFLPELVNPLETELRGPSAP